MPSKVKEVYLAHLLSQLGEHKARPALQFHRPPSHVASCLSPTATPSPLVQVRSAIIFTATCKGCHLLSLLLGELGIACTSLHSGEEGSIVFLTEARWVN